MASVKVCDLCESLIRSEVFPLKTAGVAITVRVTKTVQTGINEDEDEPRDVCVPCLVSALQGRRWDANRKEWLTMRGCVAPNGEG